MLNRTAIAGAVVLLLARLPVEAADRDYLQRGEKEVQRGLSDQV